MSRMGQLFQVELPNALPMIFTGIRIAVVNAIGTAVFAAFVAAAAWGIHLPGDPHGEYDADPAAHAGADGHCPAV